MVRIGATALAALLVACSSATTSSGAGPRSNRNVITAEEIQAARRPGSTAWELISALRPLYLTSRGITSLGNASSGVGSVSAVAIVHLDGSRYGDLQSLKDLNADTVHHVQYMNAADATTRYGTDHSGGVILIYTR
jgi:hypothetical protein